MGSRLACNAYVPQKKSDVAVRTAEEILLEAGASIGKTADDNGGGELKIVEDRIQNIIGTVRWLQHAKSRNEAHGCSGPDRNAQLWCCICPICTHSCGTNTLLWPGMFTESAEELQPALFLEAWSWSRGASHVWL